MQLRRLATLTDVKQELVIVCRLPPRPLAPKNFISIFPIELLPLHPPELWCFYVICYLFRETQLMNSTENAKRSDFMENATATYSGWSVQTVNKSQMTSFLLLVESVMNRTAILFFACGTSFVVCKSKQQLPQQSAGTLRLMLLLPSCGSRVTSMCFLDT